VRGRRRAGGGRAGGMSSDDKPSARALFGAFPKAMKAKQSDAPEGAGLESELWPKENNKAARSRKWSYGDLLTTRQAFWHCMTLVLGLGTLTIPYTLKEVGWAGLLVLAALAWLSAHTAKLLCVCIDYVPEEAAGRGIVQVLNNYPDIGEAAYGRRGRLFVEFILYVDLVASSALFLVFIANNLAVLWPGLLSTSAWIVLTAVSLLPTVWLKLQKLTFLSALGSYIMLALVAAVLYAAVMTAPGSLEGNEYHWARFRPNALGNMIFAFAMHGTLLTIYRDMRTPSEAAALFDKVYLSGYLLKLTVGATGYYLFAQHTTDQISLNLPFAGLKTAITLAVTLKKWLTYALPLEPVAVELERYSEGRSLLIRSALVGLTVVLAVALPFFGLFQSLVGSLCAGFLVLVFPLLFYLKLFGHKLSRREKWANVALLLFSSWLVAIASYESTLEALAFWNDANNAVSAQ
jgi:vesicular inhibitory amino acid transporter